MLEIAGAIGVLIPRLAGVAALGLVVLMTGAFVTRVAGLGGAPVIEALFLIASAVVAYARRADIRSLVPRARG